MNTDLTWYDDLESARKFARSEGKGVLLQFDRDGCAGCKKMNEITYHDPGVKSELFEWFVPVHQDILKDRAIRSKYSAYWTPSFYFLDSRGNVQYYQNGYLNPEDFQVLLRLGKAAIDMPRGKYFEVIDLMDHGIKNFPDNPKSPTMLFTRGIAEYLLGKEKSAFRGTMAEIIAQYPDSQEARMWPWQERQ